MKKLILRITGTILIFAAVFSAGCGSGTGSLSITLDGQDLNRLLKSESPDVPSYDFCISASINGVNAEIQIDNDAETSEGFNKDYNLTLENVPVGTGRLKISLGQKDYPVYIKADDPDGQPVTGKKILYGYNKDIMVAEGENTVSVTLEAYTNVFYSDCIFDSDIASTVLGEENFAYYFAEPDYLNRNNITLPGIKNFSFDNFIGYAFDEKGVLYLATPNANYNSMMSVYTADPLAVEQDLEENLCYTMNLTYPSMTRFANSCFTVGNGMIYGSKKENNGDFLFIKNKKENVYPYVETFFYLRQPEYKDIMRIASGTDADYLYMAWSYDNDGKKQYCVSSVSLIEGPPENPNSEANIVNTAELGEILGLSDDERDSDLLKITDLIYKDGSVWVLVNENTGNDPISINDKNTLISRGAVIQLSPDTLEKQGVYGWTEKSCATWTENYDVTEEDQLNYAFYGQSDLSSGKFIGPEGFCGVRPGELVINEAGYVYDKDSRSAEAVRLVTFDLNTKQIQVNYKNKKPGPFIRFEAPDPFSITVSVPGWKSDGRTGTVEYSTDSVSWNIWNGEEVHAVKPSGDDYFYLYFRGQGNKVITGENNILYENNISYQKSRWVITTASGYDPVGCYGNIMTLLNYKNPDSAVMDPYCFCYMFSKNYGLTAAPELPAEILSEGCYYGMFHFCIGLEEAPKLTATELAEKCYCEMFFRSSLTAAPELPAEQLADNCYSYMFANTGLKIAPELPAEQLADNCYSFMFSGCTGLTEAPVLHATTLKDYCYRNMFSGCTELTEAPVLPATQLEIECYYEMFSGCTGLTTAPALPATTLKIGCYYKMFSGCTSLKAAPKLPATQLVYQCYYNMFKDCKKLKISTSGPDENCFLKMPASGSIGLYAVEGMFDGTNEEGYTSDPEPNSMYYYE